MTKSPEEFLLCMSYEEFYCVQKDENYELDPFKFAAAYAMYVIEYPNVVTSVKKAVSIYEKA